MIVILYKKGLILNAKKVLNFNKYKYNIKNIFLIKTFILLIILFTNDNNIICCYSIKYKIKLNILEFYSECC